MNDEEFKKALKENRPLSPRVGITGEQIWQKIESDDSNRSTKKGLVFGAMGAGLASFIILFAMFFGQSGQPAQKELEAIAIVEEAFASDYLSDYEVGEDYLALAE